MSVGIHQANIDGASLAGGVLAAEILETLFDKGILDLTECRAILERAINGLSPVALTNQGHVAQMIIGELQKGKFSARG